MTQAGVGPHCDETLEFLRRAYASTREWYDIAERKAQIILGVNGILVTVVLGSIFGKLDQLHNLKLTLHPSTWILGALVACSVVGAVSCAALCMWSLHGNASLRELTEMGVDSRDGDTYRPEALWYFGHLANLDATLAVGRLRSSNRDFEIQVLSHHLVGLARRVQRKHRFVNGAWALTSAALILAAVTAVSVIIQI